MNANVSLRDYLASQERIEADFEISSGMAEALAGPRPGTNEIDFLKWEAKWRAALKYLRADAMLAESEKKKWRDVPEDFFECVKALMRVSFRMMKDTPPNHLIMAMREAYANLEPYFESEDPRENGWVSDKGLP